MIRPEFTPSPGMDATPVYEAADPQLKTLFGALNGAVAALDLGQPHTPAPPRWALNVHADLLNVTPGPDWTDDELAYCLRLRA
ncbi:MAG: hypothetical protein ACPG4T_14005, partial [Nannocystaceae bacterium]